MAVQPVSQATPKQDLGPTGQDQKQAQKGGEMEEVKVTGEMIDAKGRQIKSNHAKNIKPARPDMPSRPLWPGQDARAQD